MLKNKKAVIFDLDGTLVDSLGIWGDIDIEYLGSYGLEVPDGLQHEIEGLSFTETAAYFREHFPIEESLDEIKETWKQMAMEKYRRSVLLKPGVKEFLPYLKEKGILMAVASSNDRALIEAVLESHGVRGFFSHIVTACEVNKGKPAPDVYLKAAQKLGVSSGECLVFEDIVAGIQAGKNAGMEVCAVEDGYSMFQREEKRAAADYYINTYEQVITDTYEEL